MIVLGKIFVFLGGVGGVKFVVGFDQVFLVGDLMIVCNIVDDFEYFGLYIVFDFDSVFYVFVGFNDIECGWG